MATTSTEICVGALWKCPAAAVNDCLLRAEAKEPVHQLIGATMKKLLSILASAIVLALPLAVISTPAAAQTPAAPAAAPTATPAAPAKADKAVPAKAPKAKKAKRKAKAKMAKKPA